MVLELKRACVEVLKDGTREGGKDRGMRERQGRRYERKRAHTSFAADTRADQERVASIRRMKSG